MFSGTIIDELMAVVARAEENVEAKSDEIYSVPLPEYCGDAALAGVA
jgi:hypothetical protein